MEKFMVNAYRLDDLTHDGADRVDFIKIDVEGAEPLVFEGAVKTIGANPQLNIVMEWSPAQIGGAGFEISAFLKQLQALELSAFDMDDDTLPPITFETLAILPYRAGILLRRRG